MNLCKRCKYNKLKLGNRYCIMCNTEYSNFIPAHKDEEWWYTEAYNIE